MVYCSGQRCTIEVACREAQAVSIRSDGLPDKCPMQRRLGDVWFALLILPLGCHTLHYFARIGGRTICVGNEQVRVTQAETWTQ